MLTIFRNSAKLYSAIYQHPVSNGLSHKLAIRCKWKWRQHRRRQWCYPIYQTLLNFAIRNLKLWKVWKVLSQLQNATDVQLSFATNREQRVASYGICWSLLIQVCAKVSQHHHQFSPFIRARTGWTGFCGECFTPDALPATTSSCRLLALAFVASIFSQGTAVRLNKLT